MCNIGSAISHAFSFGSGHATTALLEAQGEAQQAAQSASAALTKAITNMTAASVPANDNPLALAAIRARMAQASMGQGAAFSFQNTPSVAPATATKILLGS